MSVKRLKKLLGYINSGDYKKAWNSLKAFAIHVITLKGKFKKSRTPELKIREEVLSRFYGIDEQNEHTAGKGLKVDVVLEDGDFLPKSSAFIRLLGPLSTPFIRNKISLAIHGNKYPVLRSDCDICIVQRAPFNTPEEVKELLRQLEDRRAKLIVDTDDAFHAVGEQHPEFKKINKKHAALKKLLYSTDQVWSSTDVLSAYYQQTVSASVHTIPNTLDARVWRQFSPEPVQSTEPLRLIYMGTATHSEDFQMIVPYLDELHAKHPFSFTLTVVGVAPSLPDKPWIKTVQRGANDVMYPRFVRWLQSQGPYDIGLSPLINNEFNKSKSDIKCLDYLGIGAIPLVSDLTPYQNPGLGRFIIKVNNNKEAWVSRLENILNDTENFRKKRLDILESAQNYIQGKRSSVVAAKQQYQLLKDLGSD